ncbi:myelin-associated glycoprotein-like isoform X2 [Hippocampus comes]|uniref:myelin-associated glycoprotein-like isoform X2 n=1 Tax=Hippocampus comes TaxID=109280 RepID=UPI00094E1510|nr:PREDICTED: myelin-associated glycoprotein-like isoform X2 [Hippocampus comes]
MNTVNSSLLFLFFFSEVICVKASSWTIELPSSVKGLPGSCVVIPCSFNYPDPQMAINEFTGIWLEAENHLIYHPNNPKIKQQYQGRTELVGDVRQKNCSLKIDPLQQSDQGPFHFRVEMKGFEKFSYRDKTVSVQMIHAPVNVHVDFNANVKEGEAVRLKCSCDANPPAISYEWHNEDGAELHKGSVFVLANVSRHTGALYCTATNALGRATSSPAQLNVTYAPVIKSVSSCSSDGEMVKCVCIAESRPPSNVHFSLPDTLLPRPDVERHDSITIGTLRAFLPSSELVYCVANNAMGNASAAITLPVHSKMLYLYVIIAAGGVLMLVILLVVMIKKW